MMFYNQYNPYYMQQPAPRNDDRIYVQGEVGAKAYLVAPGNTVTLWDSEQQAIYVKSVTVNGMPSIQRYIYALDSHKTEATAKDDNILVERITALETAINSLKTIIEKNGGVIGVEHEPGANDSAV